MQTLKGKYLTKDTIKEKKTSQKINFYKKSLEMYFL